VCLANLNDDCIDDGQLVTLLNAAPRCVRGVCVITEDGVCRHTLLCILRGANTCCRPCILLFEEVDTVFDQIAPQNKNSTSTAQESDDTEPGSEPNSSADNAAGEPLIYLQRIPARPRDV
jgi:hypothetical protein